MTPMTSWGFTKRRWLIGFGLAGAAIVGGALGVFPASMSGALAIPGLLLVLDAGVLGSVFRGLSFSGATDEQVQKAEAVYLSPALIVRRNLTTATVAMLAIITSTLIQDVDIAAAIGLVAFVGGVAVFAWHGFRAFRAATANPTMQT